jgi:Fic family protein
VESPSDTFISTRRSSSRPIRFPRTVYVPPPPDKLPGLLSELEKYIHADDPLPKLVRAGLLPVQFETIHPYLDGNGRIGRLLIALLLEQWGLLKAPLLYLSLFFKRHREEYYRRLNLVRLEGDWEGWTDFFLDVVATIADEAVASARELFNLVSVDRAQLLGAESASVSALRLFEQLPRHPIVTVASAMKLIEASKPTATRAIEALAEVGVLVETTGKKRATAALPTGPIWSVYQPERIWTAAADEDRINGDRTRGRPSRSSP